jgi:glycosyltransferase involved in cell wall biosynthesis
LYCDPYDEESIYKAVEEGIRKPKSKELKNFVIENYSWENYINKLYECYEKIISNH